MHKEGNNRELAEEAKKTTDVARQTVLAEHSSDMVVRALSTNPNLDPTLVKVVRNKLNLVRMAVHDAAANAVEK